jgi:hypothetical protein
MTGRAPSAPFAVSIFALGRIREQPCKSRRDAERLAARLRKQSAPPYSTTDPSVHGQQRPRATQ